MPEWLAITTAVLVSLGALVGWDFAVIVALRAAGIRLSFTYRVRNWDDELFAAVRNRGTYVLISGILLFACPLFLMSTFYDYLVTTFIEKRAYTTGYVVGSVVLFGLFVLVGVWSGANRWSKRSRASQ